VDAADSKLPEVLKVLSCYGLYLPELDQTWLRFVDGRLVRAITTQCLEWSCQRLEARRLRS